ncbi:alpha/beta fold hydrolase [Vibrio sp. 1180_3]|nr:alpha/beta fold hydrolase [Vibrio sp. 1180_3]
MRKLRYCVAHTLTGRYIFVLRQWIKENMKRIMLVSLCCFSSASMATIGIAEGNYQDNERGRVIEAKLFYPTTMTTPETIFAENIAFYGFKAAKSAIPKGRNFPLYILVHGTSGNWKNLSWLASELAEKGAFVVSANHPSYTTGQATPESVLRMWDQPRDVSFLVDQILSSDYAQYVDKDNITVIGYSLGGYTALALAGAKFDIKGYQEYCNQHNDTSCDYYSNAFNDLSLQERLMISGDYRDKRITNAVAIAPGYVPAILPKSLDTLSAKTLIVGAELDKTIPPNLQITPYINTSLSNLSYKEIKGASHFSFMQVCKPQAIEILAEEGAAFVCQETGNVDRSSIHQGLLEVLNPLK